MHSNKLAVVEVSEGFLSCQALDDIASGSFLTDVWGVVLDAPTSHTVQVEKNKHVIPEGVLKYWNHSCQPNAKFIYERHATSYPSLNTEHEVFWYAVATRDIKKGENITHDYNANEYDIAQHFQCHCGEEKCLGEIKGFKYLSLEQQKAIASDLSPAITE
ncbi:hypothetical protein ACROYT_G020000, partial [Oculina patagonica]